MLMVYKLNMVLYDLSYISSLLYDLSYTEYSLSTDMTLKWVIE